MFPGPVCVSLTPARAADVFAADIEGADCVEARLDYLERPSEAADIRWSEFPVPVIATCRGRARGGRFAGSAEEELQVLERAARHGARFVDLDFRIAGGFRGAEVIGSHHDFQTTPEGAGDLLGQACASPASVAKLATMVQSWEDNRRLLELLDRSWAKPVIVIGMGAMGQITRLAGPSRGSMLTYASSGRVSAPGQISLRELLDDYRFRRIRADTRIIGILGNPVEHSVSPSLHNRAFSAAGLDYVYLKFPAESVADFMANAAAVGIQGFSVTIPHKVEVMQYMDEITPEARSVGAVNTVSRREGRWIGDNTDVHGIRESLKGLDIGRLRVLILGSGGAARAAVAALRGAASVTLLSSRRPPGFLEWAQRVAVDRIENAPRYEADLLINATPVGMSPNADATPLSGPFRAGIAFDMVYTPARTRFLEEAAAEGLRTVAGTTMFVTQAARQFEIWTGIRPPAGVYSLEGL